MLRNHLMQSWYFLLVHDVTVQGLKPHHANTDQGDDGTRNRSLSFVT